MAKGMEAFLQGLQGGRLISDPIMAALEAKRQREFQADQGNEALRGRLLLESAMNRKLGIEQGPGAVENVRGVGNTFVAAPSTVEPGQEQAAVTAGQNVSPLMGGLYINKALGLKEIEAENARDIAKAKALQRPVAKQFVGFGAPDAQGNPMGVFANPETGTFETGALPPGFMTKSQSSRTAAGRVLTPNAQSSILGSAGKAGLDPDDPKYYDATTKQYDFTRLAIDAGKASRENKLAENKLKAEGLTGEVKSKIAGLNAAEEQLGQLRDEIAKIAQSGDTPGLLDSFIAVETAAPASGGLGALYQRALKSVQSDESVRLENRKSVVQSTITRAISGMAVTESEAKRLGFLPRPEDSFEQLVVKSGLLQDYIDNERKGLGKGSSVPSTPLPTAQSQINQEAYKWLLDNPNDPDAPAVRKKLGL